jgi:hypothetical protein
VHKKLLHSHDTVPLKTLENIERLREELEVCMAAEEWTEALDVAKDLRFLCPCDTGLGKEIYNTEYNAEIFCVSNAVYCGSRSWGPPGSRSVCRRSLSGSLIIKQK